MTTLHMISAPWLLLLLPLSLSLSPNSAASATNFLFNGFSTKDLSLLNDTRIDRHRSILLTDDSNYYSIGRAFFPNPLPIKSSNSTSSFYFSTTFIFSILPRITRSPGFGLAFVLSASTNPPGALPGQYFGLFPNTNTDAFEDLIAIEFDTGRNPEFDETDDNHVGVDLASIISANSTPAGFWNSSNLFEPIAMRTGHNIQAWIEFDGLKQEINITIAPAGNRRPSRPLLSFKDDSIAQYFSDEMYIGFSASKVSDAAERQRVLAWSLDTEGVARALDTSNLPIYSVSEFTSLPLSQAAIAGIASACVIAFLCLVAGIGYWWFFRRPKMPEAEEEAEEWEVEYWPHRIAYEDLLQATDGFAKEGLIGSGGFGKVYKGVLPGSGAEVAVKCVNHDSKQGMREFLAEIWSVGRLQHRRLLQLRGWCRRADQLMLVYDFLPNGSLDRHIFGSPEKPLSWSGRRQVIADVAEGLLYLHEGWEQQVLHRDVKSSNVLLDTDMRGRLGDFGLARLYQHGQTAQATRVVGTLGYLAPELARAPAPTAASDVYSFGVVVLEVASGRRPIETWRPADEPVLVDWVRGLYTEGKLVEAADSRIAGEYGNEEMDMFLKLGLACCHPDPKERPSMRQVVGILFCTAVAPVAAPVTKTSSDDKPDQPEP
ncbi:hypothetical protein AMTRI_Chr06g176780 [Amborella trichopoda]